MTDEYQRLLDRDRSRVEAYEVREVATPLLTEIVNHASMALARCIAEASNEPDVDVGPLFLYHQAIEVTDGIQELVESACARACTPLLRVLLETLVSLEFILAEEASFRSRSLAWYVGFLHRELKKCDHYDETRQSGRELASSWEEFHGAPLGMHTAEELDERRAALRKRLAMPHLAPIDARWRSTNPRNWYSLDGGASDLRSLLIKHLPHRVPDYDILYRSWSGMAHAVDPTDVITTTEDGTAFWPIRFTRDLAATVRMAASDSISVTVAMLKKYRPGEKEALKRWYLEKLKPSLDSLERLNRAVWDESL